jgi:ribosomal protein S27E
MARCTDCGAHAELVYAHRTRSRYECVGCGIRDRSGVA